MKSMVHVEMSGNKLEFTAELYIITYVDIEVDHIVIVVDVCVYY